MATAGYENHPSLQFVYLEDSFVLEINEADGILEFVMEIVVLPGHQKYVLQNEEGKLCYANAILRFCGVENLIWITKSDKFFVDKNNEIDYGNIDSLIFDEGGYYEIEGDWGRVRLRAKCLELKIIEK